MKLTPVVRPKELSKIILETIEQVSDSSNKSEAAPETPTTAKPFTFQFPSHLTRIERLHLLSMFNDTEYLTKVNKSNCLHLPNSSPKTSSNSSSSTLTLSPLIENFQDFAGPQDSEDDSGSEDSFASLEEDLIQSLKRGSINGVGKRNDAFKGFYQDLLLEELEETFYDAEW